MSTYGDSAYGSDESQFGEESDRQLDPVVRCTEPTIGSDFSLNHYLCSPTQQTCPDGGRVFTVPFIFGGPAMGILRLRLSAPSSSIEQRMNTGNNTISTEQITQIISGSIE